MNREHTARHSWRHHRHVVSHHRRGGSSAVALIASLIAIRQAYRQYAKGGN
jgi:hypothetical protein